MKSKTLPAWARLVCTVAAALVFLLVYEWAVYGVPLGRIYLPASAWSDEVYYAGGGDPRRTARVLWL